MKIYLIDKYKNKNFISKYFNQEVEVKENCKFRMTKNDFVITSENEETEGLEKLKNIIFLTKNQEYKHIWKLANDFKTIDIIDENLKAEYVIERIKKKVGVE